MLTELDERVTLVAPRAVRGPVKAEARSLATRASVQAAKVFMFSVGGVSEWLRLVFVRGAKKSNKQQAGGHGPIVHGRRS